jgi:hypothetical protein
VKTPIVITVQTIHVATFRGLPVTGDRKAMTTIAARKIGCMNSVRRELDRDAVPVTERAADDDEYEEEWKHACSDASHSVFVSDVSP